MSVLTYDGTWQRHDGRAETVANQHAAGRSSSQPNRLIDEHQPKDYFQGLAEVHGDWRRFMETGGGSCGLAEVHVDWQSC